MKISTYDIPFVPSSDDRLKTMMELANIKPGEFSLDLGSGDGKVVIEMAKRGAIAYGFEIDRERALLGEENIKKENLEKNAFIYNKNFWYEDLSLYNLITLYGITSIMERLEKKLLSELAPGSRVISNFFQFPNWKHEAEKSDVYLYTVSQPIFLPSY